MMFRTRYMIGVPLVGGVNVTQERVWLTPQAGSTGIFVEAPDDEIISKMQIKYRCEMHLS